MAIGLVVGLISLAAGLYIASQQKPAIQPTGQDMSPNTMESFRTNTSNEGAVVPFIFGTVRLSTNYLWYGNLETREVTEEVTTSGGKGGGGSKTEKITVGYRYFMDLWLSLCLGPNVEIVDVFRNDKLMILSLYPHQEQLPLNLNPGHLGTYPDFLGLEYATPMNPVAHVWGRRVYLGENVSNIPTFHYVLKRISTAPLYNVETGYGTNPAAAIYDILISVGVPAVKIDLTSFNDASSYWLSKGYGLNLIYSKQEEARDLINRIFTYVDGNIRTNSQDKIELKAWKDTDTYDVEIADKTEFKSFTFSRRTWDDVNTDFRANYIDKNQNYTERTIRVINTAVREIIGYPRQITIDLTAYNDVNIASKRLWEMMKRLSYPEAQIVVKVPMKYYQYRVGDIVRINNDDYGIIDADFRITDLDIAESDSNEIGWTLTQVVENIFDSTYVVAGNPEYEQPDYAPQVPYDQNIYELPYNDLTGNIPSFLFLCARKGVETSFTVLQSPSGTDYTEKHLSTRWSQHGYLNQEYSSDTFSIDGNYDGTSGYGFEGDGILYTFERNDPEFNDIARETLFNSARIAILGDPQGTCELVGFEKVEYVSATQNRLRGVIRGVLNTPVLTHTTGTEIWITTVDFSQYGNIVSGLFTQSNFYLKYLPNFGENQLDASLSPSIHYQVTDNWNGQYKAVTPWGFNSVVITRTGSNNVVKVEQLTQISKGAGREPLETSIYAIPSTVEGIIEWSYDNFSTIGGTETTADFTIVNASSFTIYFRVNNGGIYSQVQSMVVSAADGTYYLQDHMKSETSLEHIRWSTQGWKDIFGRNTQRLNDTLLKVSGLLDVNDSSITDKQVLIWDETSQKFIPENYYIAFPTTTTSTTTTTSSTSTSSSTSTNTQSFTSTSSSTSTNTQSTTSSSTLSSTSSSTSTFSSTSTLSSTSTNTQSTTSTSTNTQSTTSSSTLSSTSTNTQSTTSSSTSTSTFSSTSISTSTFSSTSTSSSSITTSSSSTTTTIGDFLAMTDFSEYTLEQQPNDWTERWYTTAASATVEAGGGFGEKHLFLDGTNSLRYLVSWDELDGFNNGEFIAKATPISSSTYFYMPIWRASGSGSSETGLALYYNGGNYYYGYLNSGSYTNLGQVSKTINVGTWYRFRIQFNGNDHKIKIWENGTSEPETWDIEFTDSTISSGNWLGTQIYNNDINIDFFGFSSLINDPLLQFPTTTTTTSTTTTTTTTI